MAGTSTTTARRSNQTASATHGDLNSQLEQLRQQAQGLTQERDGLKTNVISSECPGSNRDRLAQKTGVESVRASHIPAHNFVLWHDAMPTIHATLVEFWERIVAQPAIVYSSGNAFGICWQSTDLRRTISSFNRLPNRFPFP